MNANQIKSTFYTEPTGMQSEATYLIQNGFSSGASTQAQSLFQTLRNGLTKENGNLQLNLITQRKYNERCNGIYESTPQDDWIDTLQMYANSAWRSMPAFPDLSVVFAIWMFYYQEKRYYNPEVLPQFDKGLVTSDRDLVKFLYSYMQDCGIPVSFTLFNEYDGFENLIKNWDKTKLSIFNITGESGFFFENMQQKIASLQPYMFFTKGPIILLATNDQIKKSQYRNLGVAEC